MKLKSTWRRYALIIAMVIGNLIAAISWIKPVRAESYGMAGPLECYIIGHAVKNCRGSCNGLCSVVVYSCPTIPTYNYCQGGYPSCDM